MRLALAAVSAMALLAAACGGVESEPNLANAVERTDATGSFAFEMSAGLVDEGEEMEWECAGEADRVLNRARLVCADRFAVLTIGGSTYYDDGTTDGKWWKGDEEPIAELEPVNILGVLMSAVREKRVGEEKVRGVATVHYAVTVVCDEPDLFGCKDQTTVVHAWVDDEGYVRRIRVDESGVKMIVEYFDFGEPVDIEPPRADEIFEPPLLDPHCKATDAGSIGVDEAAQVLRRHGFEVRLEEGTCGGSVAGSFSTTLPDGSMSDDDILSCAIYVQPLVAGSASLRNEPPVVDRRLENLECTLWVEGSGAEAIGRLDAAFAELRRGVGG